MTIDDLIPGKAYVLRCGLIVRADRSLIPKGTVVILLSCGFDNFWGGYKHLKFTLLVGDEQKEVGDLPEKWLHIFEEFKGVVIDETQEG